jgi:uncharacterized Fe-S cluster protein YjdI
MHITDNLGILVRIVSAECVRGNTKLFCFLRLVSSS